MYTAIVRSVGRYIACFFAILLGVCTEPAFTQQIDMDAVRAREEFRWGVKAYHSGIYNDAIRAFERAAGFKPDDVHIQEWLGYGYYRAGFEEIAVGIWEGIAESGEATSLLYNFIDTVNARRGLARELAVPERYVVIHEISGRAENYALFERPTSLFSTKDGFFYLTSFIGNQVLKFSTNGAVRQKFLGGIQGLNHPYDVLETRDGFIFISEFSGNQIFRSDLRGQQIRRFGEKGINEGQLMGPQYLADNGKGYIYISESGNRRISKFDYEGNFILSFGRKTDRFRGFQSPTGIFVYRDLVYVCDERLKSVAVFDESGNFIRFLAEGELENPEGLSLFNDGVLLIADTTRLLTLDLESESVSVLSELNGDSIRLTKAVRDANSGIVAVDNTKENVTLLTSISSMYTGFFVEIERVISDNYPEVVMEISVEDRLGDPFIGMDSSNFIISENHSQVRNAQFFTPEETQYPAIAVLVDRSLDMKAFGDSIQYSAGDLYDAVDSRGRISLVTAGEVPVKEVENREARHVFIDEAVYAGAYTDTWHFDRGLRLAASDLATWPGPRAVVFITLGNTREQPFEDYKLDVLARYMRNNSIAFYCIYVVQNPEYPQELEYLCRETGGESMYAYRPEGMAPVVADIAATPTGRYFFSYNSSSETDFGNTFLPVAAEVFLFERSGRSELGYYAPLEF